MGRLGYCITCGEENRPTDATIIIDGAPLCNSHAAKLVPLSAALTVREPKLTRSEPILPRISTPPKPPAPRAPGPTYCTRGCGNLTHPGLCKGGRRVMPAQQPTPSASPVTPQPKQETATRMDKLKARTIPRHQVPVVGRKVRSIGRAGEIWSQFIDLASGQALEIVCRDHVHVGTTARGLRDKALAAGIKFGEERHPDRYYCWKEEAR